MGQEERFMGERVPKMPSLDEMGIPELDAIGVDLLEIEDPQDDPLAGLLDDDTPTQVNESIKDRYEAQITEPPALVQSLAKKAGVSTARAEELWTQAKKAAKEQYPDVDTDSDRFYSIVTGILKKMMGLTDSIGGPEALAGQVGRLCERVDHLCDVLERVLGAEE